MAEESKKSRRRRRRPRSTAKNRAKAAAKAPAAESKSSGGSRRGRSRRRSTGSSKNKKRASQEALTIQRHAEKPISPIDKNIFIYTYTLRPRSLLEGYEAGPNVAEKMAFERPEEGTLSD